MEEKAVPSSQCAGRHHQAPPEQMANAAPHPCPNLPGYARALRYHLSTSLSPEEYEALDWVKAGATELRFQASCMWWQAVGTHTAGQKLCSVRAVHPPHPNGACTAHSHLPPTSCHCNCSTGTDERIPGCHAAQPALQRFGAARTWLGCCRAACEEARSRAACSWR